MQAECALAKFITGSRPHSTLNSLTLQTPHTTVYKHLRTDVNILLSMYLYTALVEGIKLVKIHK